MRSESYPKYGRITTDRVPQLQRQWPSTLLWSVALLEEWKWIHYSSDDIPIGLKANIKTLSMSKRNYSRRLNELAYWNISCWGTQECSANLKSWDKYTIRHSHEPSWTQNSHAKIWTCILPSSKNNPPGENLIIKLVMLMFHQSSLYIYSG